MDAAAAATHAVTVTKVVGDQGPEIPKGLRECNITIFNSNVFCLVQLVIYLTFTFQFFFIVIIVIGQGYSKMRGLWCAVALPDDNDDDEFY
jgi:hypothetical protein